LHARGRRRVRRLLLVRHASTTATRAFAFPTDEPLDDRGQRAAAGLKDILPDGCEVLCSPARRCRETAAAALLASPTLEAALGECGFGTWAGRALAEIAAADPQAVASWMTDPAARPHGGESLESFATRVSVWLDLQAFLDGSAVAITHGGVVKAAVAHALGAPIEAFWRIDAAPLSVTEIHSYDGRWTLIRANCVIACHEAAA
jgi:broad specificity phosphatase PhoE